MQPASQMISLDNVAKRRLLTTKYYNSLPVCKTQLFRRHKHILNNNQEANFKKNLVASYVQYLKMLVLQPTHHQFVTILRYQTLQSLFKQDQRSLPLLLLSLCIIPVHFVWRTASVTITTHKQQASKHMHSNHVPVLFTKGHVNNLKLKLKLNFEIEARF